MKKEKIEEMWNNHTQWQDDDCDTIMYLDEFTDAINQAELEWYKELEKKLNIIADNYDSIVEYIEEIENKIKELENEN